MSSAVLDASALLALIYEEPGGDYVEQIVDAGAAVGTVNLSEVAATLSEAGMHDRAVRETLAALDVAVYPFDATLAYEAGILRPQARRAGLSLGDRACLALARQLGLPALTTDRNWARLHLGVTVRVIR